MKEDWAYDPADLSPFLWGAIGCGALGMWLNAPGSVAFSVGILVGFVFVGMVSEKKDKDETPPASR